MPDESPVPKMPRGVNRRKAGDPDRMPVDRPARGRARQSKASVERDAEALRLRSEGWTIQAINVHLKFGGHSNVIAAIDRCTKRIIEEPARAVLEQMLHQLDAVTNTAMTAMRAFHPALHQGEPVVMVGDDGRTEVLRDWRPNMAAADRVTRAVERRARILGVDAPERTEITVTSEADAAMAAVLREVQEHNQRLLDRIIGQAEGGTDAG